MHNHATCVSVANTNPQDTKNIKFVSPPFSNSASFQTRSPLLHLSAFRCLYVYIYIYIFGVATSCIFLLGVASFIKYNIYCSRSLFFPFFIFFFISPLTFLFSFRFLPSASSILVRPCAFNRQCWRRDYSQEHVPVSVGRASLLLHCQQQQQQQRCRGTDCS